MLDLILNYRVDAQRIYSLLLVLALLRWGGGPERALAIAWAMIYFIFHRGYHAVFNNSEWDAIVLSEIDVLHAGIDGVLAIVFVAIALYANRTYILWIASFQLLALTAHFVRGMTDAITPVAYYIMVVGPSYFQLIIMTFGLWQHCRRLAEYGAYRDWRIPVIDRLVPILGKGPQV